MAKFIYAKSKAGFNTAYETSLESIEKSIAFMEDGWIWTHGKFFRLHPDKLELTSILLDGTVSIKDGTETVTSFDVGVTGITGDDVIKVGTLTNGVIGLTHALRASGASANLTNTVGTDLSGVKIPSLTVNKFGHVTSMTSENIAVDRVAATTGAGSFYLLGHADSAAGTATAIKNSNIFGDSSGNLTASKFTGNLANSLTIKLNGTDTVFNNSANRSISLYAPTSSGNNGQIAISTGSGFDWLTPSTTVSATSTNAQIPTAAAVWNAFSEGLSAADAMVYKGTIGTGGTITSLPTKGPYSAGWTYKVITAGTIAGEKVEIGDMVIAITNRADNISGTNADWTVVQTNIDGAVIGPASSTTNSIAVFDGNTGKLIKDSGIVPGVTGTSLIKMGAASLGFIRVNADGTTEIRSYANTKSDLSLNLVENTALSTWAGTTNIKTVGTITSGTWNGTNIALNKGGTGAALTNVPGGIVYGGSSAMAFSSAGTSGYFLTSGGSGAPTWTNPATITVSHATTATTATHLSGGAKGSIPYQTAAGTTAFLAAGSNGKVLKYNSTSGAPEWADDIDTHWTSNLYVGTTNTASNAAVATSPYLKLYENGTRRSEFRLIGAGGTVVKSDANGNITITSTHANDNTWRDVTLATKESPATYTSIGQKVLNFGSEFHWEGDQVKLAWAEVATDGTITYSH